MKIHAIDTTLAGYLGLPEAGYPRAQDFDDIPRIVGTLQLTISSLHTIITTMDEDGLLLVPEETRRAVFAALSQSDIAGILKAAAQL
jgi:hypothetical protein